MESINIVKGYGKVNSNEDQSSQFHNKSIQNPKRRITIAISLILLLTVVIGSLIGALIHESTTEPPDSPSESIRTVCSVTQHPDSCFTSISSLRITPQNDPELIFSLSLQLGASELANLSSLPKCLIARSSDPRTVSALRDCDGLFDDALSQLNNSVAYIDVGPGKKLLTEERIGDLNAWISAAMTDQETCLDGLEEMESTVLDEVKTKVQRSKEYMSNSLAILANIHPLLDKFDLKMH